MRYLIWIVISVVCSSAIAQTSLLCTPLKLKEQNKMIILPGPSAPGTSQVYFLKNTSAQGIWLDHPNGKKSMNAGWSSYLQTGKWSAFLLNRSNFLISCAVIKPGLVDYMDCTHVISVCVPKQVSFKEKTKGTYWLVEDKTWEEMIKVVEKRGIKISETH